MILRRRRFPDFEEYKCLNASGATAIPLSVLSVKATERYGPPGAQAPVRNATGLAAFAQSMGGFGKNNKLLAQVVFTVPAARRMPRIRARNSKLIFDSAGTDTYGWKQALNAFASRAAVRGASGHDYSPFLLRPARLHSEFRA
jgi:hypothetical protein